MIYNKNLKNKAEELARSYHGIKGTASKRATDDIETEMVELVENYCFSTVFKRSIVKSKEDIMQDIRVGIVEGLRCYNPSIGKFMSWVIYYVRKHTSREKSGAWINVPVYVKDAVGKVSKKEIKEDVELSDVEKIVEATGMEGRLAQKVEHTRKLHPVSLEDYSGTQDPTDSMNTRIDVVNAVNKLNPQQKLIAEAYFIQELDVPEISRRSGLTPSRIFAILDDVKKLLCKELATYK